MDRFMIETPHSAENCMSLIETLDAQGYLMHFEWGCLTGNHTGWAVIEAENEAEARMAVPPLVRKQARIVKVNKFENSEMARAHKGI